jgi:hypothetical protein
MHIILLAGYAGSGKDTAGAALKLYGYTRYAVADAVKLYSSKRHGFSLDLTHTQDGKATFFNNKTVRQHLIDDSAELKAIHNDPAYWIRMLAETIKNTQPQKVVITDWRYPAELTHLHTVFPTAQITTVRISRSCITPSNDPSEHEIDAIPTDYTVKNDTTPEDLAHAFLQIPFITGAPPVGLQ